MADPKMPPGWLQAHDEAGAKPGCGHAMLADHVNPQVAMIWFEKRIALTDDTIVRDHLERSLRWLKRALVAEQEGSTNADGGPTLSTTRPLRGGRVF